MIVSYLVLWKLWRIFSTPGLKPQAANRWHNHRRLHFLNISFTHMKLCFATIWNEWNPMLKFMLINCSEFNRRAKSRTFGCLGISRSKFHRHAQSPFSGEWRKKLNNLPCPITQPSQHHMYIFHLHGFKLQYNKVTEPFTRTPKYIQDRNLSCQLHSRIYSF